jgi:hypothetical protein
MMISAEPPKGAHKTGGRKDEKTNPQMEYIHNATTLPETIPFRDFPSSYFFLLKDEKQGGV